MMSAEELTPTKFPDDCAELSAEGGRTGVHEVAASINHIYIPEHHHP